MIWSPPARAAAREHMADQDGMRAIGDVIARLSAGETPPEVEPFGDSSTIRRVRVGPYRLLVEHVDEDGEPVLKVFYLGKSRITPETHPE